MWRTEGMFLPYGVGKCQAETQNDKNWNLRHLITCKSAKKTNIKQVARNTHVSKTSPLSHHNDNSCETEKQQQ